MHEPVDFGRGREEDAAQYQAEYAFRMRLRVRKRQCRPPRSAEDQPALEPEFLAQALEIGDQMLRGVVRKFGRGRQRPAPRWS